MTNTDDRLMVDLTERSERTLSPEETAELDGLLQANDDWHVNDFDYTEAAALMALVPQTEAMPDAMKARIIGDAMQRATQGGPPTPVATRQPPASNDDDGAANTNKTRSVSVWIAWAAAAAAVAFAVFAWQDTIFPAPDVAAQRSALISEDASAVTVAWTRTEDPLGTQVSGDVVWSSARQEGFMRFSGLPANDPAKNQYQLWVFDKERDERFPVDGGVFDIDAQTGEVIVPIKAKIRVTQATLFAVTLEKPGGVVVSTRERLVTVAKPAT